MQYLSDGEGPWTKQQTEQLTDSYNDVKRSLTGYRLSGRLLTAGLPMTSSRPQGSCSRHGNPNGQLSAKNHAVSDCPSTTAPLRYCSTAVSGTRYERPNRTAGISPEWTSRYTVI